MDFNNKNIIITGISSDIGIKLASTFMELNGNVIGIYHNNKPSLDIKYYKCDLSKEKELNKLIKNIKNDYNHIDILINLAALSIDNDIYDKSVKEFKDVINVNLIAPFYLIKELSSIMYNGIIVNMCSLDGIDTFNPISLDYCASKAGLINLTKNLSLKFNNIKICGMAPNWIDTSSTREMHEDYLSNELKRINQKKLISIDEVVIKILEIIVSSDIVSGNIIEMR